MCKRHQYEMAVIININHGGARRGENVRRQAGQAAARKPESAAGGVWRRMAAAAGQRRRGEELKALKAAAAWHQLKISVTRPQ